MESKSFNEIFKAIFDSLDQDKLPDSNSALLQIVFRASRPLFNWESLFDKPMNNDVTEEKCNQLREKGRIFLQKKNMMEALSCFSRYIRLCHQLPENETIDRSKRNQFIQQGYLGRSMIFYRVICSTINVFGNFCPFITNCLVV